MSISYQVTLLPSQRIFTVDSDEIILDAALRQGVELPYNCAMASCGTCRSRLLSGKVSYGDVTLYALEEEEKALGFMLLCSAKPRSDLIIEILIS